MQITDDKAPDCWDDRSELCSLKVFLLHTFISSLDSADLGESVWVNNHELSLQIFGVKALVKSYSPVKDAHLRSGIDGLIDILKNLLSFGDITREIKSR